MTCEFYATKTSSRWKVGRPTSAPGSCGVFMNARTLDPRLWINKRRHQHDSLAMHAMHLGPSQLCLVSSWWLHLVSACVRGHSITELGELLGTRPPISLLCSSSSVVHWSDCLRKCLVKSLLFLNQVTQLLLHLQTDELSYAIDSTVRQLGGHGFMKHSSMRNAPPRPAPHPPPYGFLQTTCTFLRSAQQGEINVTSPLGPNRETDSV